MKKRNSGCTNNKYRSNQGTYATLQNADMGGRILENERVSLFWRYPQPPTKTDHISILRANASRFFPFPTPGKLISKSVRPHNGQPVLRPWQYLEGNSFPEGLATASIKTHQKDGVPARPSKWKLRDNSMKLFCSRNFRSWRTVANKY